MSESGHYEQLEGSLPSKIILQPEMAKTLGKGLQDYLGQRPATVSSTGA